MTGRRRSISTEDREALEWVLANQYRRLNHLYRIKDKQSRDIPFRFNDAQEKLWQELHTRGVILKARQLGFSTQLALYMLDCCLFYPHTAAGIVANTEALAQEIFRDKIKFAFERIPEKALAVAGVRVVSDTKTSYEFSNGSTIRVDTSMRGTTLQLLHVTEMGELAITQPERAEEIITGSIPAVPKTGRVFIESTARGEDGRFYKMCNDAQANLTKDILQPTDFKFHFFPWFDEPGYVLENPEHITDSMEAYFADLEQRHGIALTEQQQWWYVNTKKTQGTKMLREYPSTPEEAFQASVQGAYYATELRHAQEQNRIVSLPLYDREYYVACDLGVGKNLATWVAQQDGHMVNVVDHFVPEDDGVPGLAVIPRWLKRRGYAENLGLLILPHDGDTADIGSGEPRWKVFVEAGIPESKILILPRGDLEDEIEATRTFIARCRFDKDRCEAGLSLLRSYRRQPPTRGGVLRAKPLATDAAHTADAYRYLGLGMPDPVDHERERARDLALERWRKTTMQRVLV